VGLGVLLDESGRPSLRDRAADGESWHLEVEIGPAQSAEIAPTASGRGGRVDERSEIRVPRPEVDQDPAEILECRRLHAAIP
jgi:hypothetical protein